MTSKFKVGDRVMLEGVIEQVDDTAPTLLIRLGSSIQWQRDGTHITYAPAHDIGLLPEQLEAVTKERDDARDQLARVCAQVETLGAELKAVKDELNDEYNGRTNAMSECIILRQQRDKAQQVADGEATHNGILRDRIDEIGRMYSRDRRILDCVATLLAMRGGES